MPCPSCDKPFEETDLLEYVKRKRPNKSRSASQSSGSSKTAAIEIKDSDDDSSDSDDEAKGEAKADGEEEDADMKPFDAEVNSRASSPDSEASAAGYVKRNDFISSTKLDALTAHLKSVRDDEPKFAAVVFSQFTGFLSLIEKALARDKFRCALRFGREAVS